MGKGSVPRPINDKKSYNEEFDRIFGRREPKEYQTGKKDVSGGKNIKPFNGKFNY